VEGCAGVCWVEFEFKQCYHSIYLSDFLKLLYAKKLFRSTQLISK